MLGKKSKVEIQNNNDNRGTIVGVNEGTINHGLNEQKTADLFRQILKEEKGDVLLKELGLGKALFQDFRDCKGLIFGILQAVSYNEPGHTSCMDNTLMPLLKAVIGAGKYSEFIVADFASKLDIVHKDEDVLNFIKCRWNAIDKLFSGNREEAVQLLEQIYSNHESSKSIPDWLKVNVLIDIRNLTDVWRQSEKFFNVQDKIAANREDVHFPALDRFDNIANSQLVSWYMKETSTSPYSITLGGGTRTTEIADSIFKSFVASAFFGSITHLWQVSTKLKKVLFFLNSKWHDGNFFADYLQACFSSWDDNDKNVLQNIFREHFSLLTFQDVRGIWSNMDTTPYSDTRRVAYKLTAMKYIGNYMNNETFAEATDDCFGLISAYVESNNSLLDIQSAVVDFIQHNIQRLDINKAVQIIFKDFAAKPDYMATMTIKAIVHANFGGISDENFGLLSDFIESSKDYWNPTVEYFSVRLRFTVDSSRHVVLDELVAKIRPTFYRGEYLFNINQNMESAEHIINKLLLMADSVQKEKEITGVAITSNDHLPFDGLRNVIAALDNSLSHEQIEKICLSITRALCDHYSLETKACALEVLSILWIKHKSVTITQVAQQTVFCEHIIQARGTSVEWISLNIFQGLFKTFSGNLNPLEYSFVLSEINHLPVSVRVRFFRYVNFICTHISFAQDSGLLIVLLRLLIDGITSQERDIRYYSIRALSRIGASCSYIGDMAIELMHKEYIGLENSVNKSYIIDGMAKIDKSHPLTAKILDEAKRGNDFELSLLADRPTYK